MIEELIGPIAVIGGNGFIGSSIVNAIWKKRKDVYVITKSFMSQSLKFFPFSNYSQTNITDPDSVYAVFKKIKPKTIFHMASYGNRHYHNDIGQIYNVNLNGLVNVLNAANTETYHAFVIGGASSELHENSHYAISKKCAHIMADYYGRTNYGISYLRFYSIYGPREEEDRLIPTLIKEGLKKRFPPLVNQNIARDFVYIDDCVDACIKAAIFSAGNKRCRTFEVATGVQTSIYEVAMKAKEIFKIKREPVFETMKNRKWDKTDWVGDPNETELNLGWKAKTRLKEGIIKTSEWMKKNGLDSKI